MKKLIISFCLFLTSVATAFAQCSDAGACAISHTPATSQLHQLGIAYQFGTSGKPDDISFHTIKLNGDFTLFEGSRLSIEFPYHTQSGPLGSTNGIGDPIVVWNESIFQTGSSELSAHLGAKLSLGDDNANNLPQAYQSSLGTNDILLGVSYRYELWNASVIYQLSSGRSGNAITPLQRGDDLLFRTGYTMPVHDVNILLELLAIKRLEESTIQDVAIPTSTVYVNIPKSDQFQINLQATGLYSLNEEFTLQTRVALPLLNRDVNVDGLKRTLTVSFGIIHLF